MTDAILSASIKAEPGRAVAIQRFGLAVGAALAVAAGLTASPLEAAQASAEAGAELTMLLRLMAAMKAATALAALGIVVWRLGYPASPALAASYVIAVTLMAAAPVPIWQIAHAGLGAALFHAGVLLAVVALFADRDRAAVASAGWSRLGRRAFH